MPAPSSADLAYHGRIAATYFERWEWPVQRLTRRIEGRWLRRLLAGRSAPRVLLAGSGGGRELEALLPLGAAVTAVDYAPESIAIGRERWGEAVEWRLGDVHDLSELPASSFDLVLSLCAFNYFVDPPLALAAMVSRTRPGGLVALSSLNAEHPTERGRATKVARQALSVDRLRAMGTGVGLTSVRTRGLRYMVDRLPEDSKRQAAAIRAEPLLAKVAGARRCKWIWMIGERPA